MTTPNVSTETPYTGRTRPRDERRRPGEWPLKAAHGVLSPGGRGVGQEARRGFQGTLGQVEPFPVKERGEGKALSRLPRQDGVDLLAQLLADRISSALAVPVGRKVFLNLNEAAEYSGLPKAWLVREIKNGNIKAIKAGEWRIRRAILEQL